MNPTITVDFLRLHFNSSSTVETALSVNAIELVTAANNTSKKNRIPANRPNLYQFLENLGFSVPQEDNSGLFKKRKPIYGIYKK